MTSESLVDDSLGIYDLKSLFEKAFRKHRDRVAIRYRGDDYTYGDLDDASTALSHGLINMGVRSEDRVGILMSNRPEFVVSELAIVKAGGTKVLLNDMLGRSDIEYILRDSRMGILICGPAFTDVIDTLYDDLPDLHTVLDLSGTVERFLPYDDALVSTCEGSPMVRPSPDDILVHAYTGGTTGRPKGVLHTHRSRAMLYYSVLLELDLTSDDTILVTTPLPHSAGSYVRSGLLTGASIVLRQKFDAGQMLADIEDHRVTWTFMVPTMVYRLLDHPDVNSADLSSMRTLIYGAAPMKSNRLREGIKRFGPVFKQFYGQTEIPNLITTLGKREHFDAVESGNEGRLSSAGQPCLMSDVKIVDPDSRAPVPIGEAGEVLARAPYVMDRYFGLPEKTAETLLDGWIATGDIGKLDEDGYLTLLDRMSNLVISGGMNVYTTEVEEALAALEAVKDSAVMGVPDDDWGEAVIAFVVSKDSTLTKEDIIAGAKCRLSSYKVPKRVIIIPSLPKTPYGKIDKTALQEHFWNSEDRRIN